MADPKRERRLAAIAAQSAAKWQRVRFRDNREPSTLRRPLMLGTPDDVRCWCGEPNGHGWLGKGDGAPHPRETQEDTR
jgi:hypothetical protein